MFQTLEQQLFIKNLKVAASTVFNFEQDLQCVCLI